MKAWKQSLAVLGLISLTALPLMAQTTPPAPPAGQAAKPTGGAAAGKLAAADTKFVQEAAVGGMAEVALGKLAATKATNPDVKQFAQRMIDDHSKANAELKPTPRRRASRFRPIPTRRQGHLSAPVEALG